MRAYVATGALVAVLAAAACVGDRGPTGTKGDRGEAGAKGDKGDKGGAGDPGAPGEDGENGQDGQNGQNGQNGQDGQDGEDGEDGAPGQPGPPADVPTCGPVPPSAEGEDSTEAIQNCIDELGEADGGTVVLQAGRYVLRNHLRFAAGDHDHVRLRGVGALTVLAIEDSTSAILIGSDAENLSACGAGDEGSNSPPPIRVLEGVSIEGVHIVGNLGVPEECCPDGDNQFANCTQYPDSTLTRNGIAVRCASNVRISNVTIDNASNAGISADHTEALVVDSAEITGPLISCVEATSTERTALRNVTCILPGLSGFNLTSTRGLTLQRSSVFDAGELFQCEVGDGGPWEKPGVTLDNVTSSTIADNFITGSTGRGIELIASNRNIISQNHITDNDVQGIALEARGCGDGSNHNLLSGNIIAGSDRPIFGVCPSVGNAVSTNICDGNEDDSIEVVGSCDCNIDDVLTVVAGPCNLPPPEDPGLR